jgi:hypothetical protein
MTERRGAEQALEEAGLPAERQRTPDEPVAEPPADQVEQADSESFPASDPPTWGGGDPIPTNSPAAR